MQRTYDELFVDCYRSKQQKDGFWDDITFPSFNLKYDVGTGRLVADIYNQAAKFASNARYPEEPLSGRLQIRHCTQMDVLKPHIHWIQSQAAVPNMVLFYKKSKNNAAVTVEIDWSNYTRSVINTHLFTYTSGSLGQISTSADIDISDLGISDFVLFALFRDSANATGLFAGADPVATDVLISDFDFHAKKCRPGSRLEYTI